jgi:4-oxalocrotonate tautomerase
MPMVIVRLVAGRSAEQKRNLASSVTEAVSSSLGSDPKNVTVILEDVAADHWSIGGTLVSDALAAPEGSK